MKVKLLTLLTFLNIIYSYPALLVESPTVKTKRLTSDDFQLRSSDSNEHSLSNTDDNGVFDDIVTSGDFAVDTYVDGKGDLLSPILPLALIPENAVWDSVNLLFSVGTSMIMCTPKSLMNRFGRIQCGVAVAATVATSASFALSLNDGLTNDQKALIELYIHNMGFNIEIGETAQSSVSMTTTIFEQYHNSKAFKTLKNMNLHVKLEPIEVYYPEIKETVTEFYLQIFGENGIFFDTRYNMEFFINKNAVRMAADSRFAGLPMKAVKNIYKTFKEESWKEIGFKNFVVSLGSVFGDKTEEFLTSVKESFSKVEENEASGCNKHGFQMNNHENVKALTWSVEKCQ